MSDANRLQDSVRTAAVQHWLPLLLLVAPIGLAVWGTGLESTPVLLVLPLAAFAIGFALKPRHVWIVWLGAVVIQWAAMGVFGKYADPEDESVASLILEAPLDGRRRAPPGLARTDDPAPSGRAVTAGCTPW